MGSKLPEDLKWSEAAITLLAETEKKSCKSVCITINKACSEKDKKASTLHHYCVEKFRRGATLFFSPTFQKAGEK